MEVLKSLTKPVEVADFYLEILGTKCDPAVRKEVISLIKEGHIKLTANKTFSPVSSLR